jgi:hypothetical protein
MNPLVTARWIWQLEKSKRDGSCDGSADEDFAGSTVAGGGEDTIGAFLDPVDDILATKDGRDPSEIGRQRTEWHLAERVGSACEGRRK